MLRGFQYLQITPIQLPSIHILDLNFLKYPQPESKAGHIFIGQSEGYKKTIFHTWI